MRSLIFKLLFLFLISELYISAEMLSRSKVAMGTFVTISLDEQNKNYIEDGFNIVNDVELSLSSYNPEATIYKLNKNKTVSLDTHTYESLLLSKKYHEQTNGYFDITIGSITKDLYKFGEAEMIPIKSKLENAIVDFKGLSFTNKEAFILKNMKVDLGGMGKGFAVDEVYKYFKAKNIKKAIIAASGDIRCIGECTIDVADPDTDSTMLSFVTLQNDMAISTSGNYNRYVTSVEHNHLINPKSKKSQLNFVSITLISTMSNSELDAYATAVSVMPSDAAYKFLNALDLAYIIMQSDKKLRYSDNIDKYIKNLVLHDRVKK